MERAALSFKKPVTRLTVARAQQRVAADDVDRRWFGRKLFSATAAAVVVSD